MYYTLSYLHRNYMRSEANHFDTYAKDSESWVVVTGGSDGVGFEVCR
jgi:hypothetical protein